MPVASTAPARESTARVAAPVVVNLTGPVTSLVVHRMALLWAALCPWLGLTPAGRHVTSSTLPVAPAGPAGPTGPGAPVAPFAPEGPLFGATPAPNSATVAGAGLLLLAPSVSVAERGPAAAGVKRTPTKQSTPTANVCPSQVSSPPGIVKSAASGPPIWAAPVIVTAAGPELCTVNQETALGDAVV